MNKKISVSVVLILLVIIGVESAIIIPYHSSNSYEALSSDSTQNATGYIVIAKLPSSSVNVKVYACDFLIGNLTLSLPKNSSLVQISEFGPSGYPSMAQLNILLNSSRLYGVNKSSFFMMGFFSNLSFFNPVSVSFITASSNFNINPGIYSQYGYEYLVVATRSVNQIRYEEVSR